MKSFGARFLVLGALVPGMAGAQTISGRVLEDSTRLPVSMATVSVLRVGGSDTRVAQTDSAGAFRLTLGEPGRFLLRVTHPFHLTLESDTLALQEDEVVTLELRLGRHAIPLEPLVVSARTDQRLLDFHQRMRKGTGFGKFVTRADIERRTGQRPTELLYSMGGVEVRAVAPCRGCATENVVYMRGGAGQCLARILVDGMDVKQGPGFSLDAILMTDMLEGIEVYVDVAGIPAALGMGSSQCGVVAFWTRTPEGGSLTWKRLGVATALVVILVLLLH